MVVMAAVFIRDQPTFLEILRDSQNTGKFCLILVNGEDSKILWRNITILGFVKCVVLN